MTVTAERLAQYEAMDVELVPIARILLPRLRGEFVGPYLLKIEELSDGALSLLVQEPAQTRLAEPSLPEKITIPYDAPSETTGDMERRGLVIDREALLRFFLKPAGATAPITDEEANLDFRIDLCGDRSVQDAWEKYKAARVRTETTGLALGDSK